MSQTNLFILAQIAANTALANLKGNATDLATNTAAIRTLRQNAITDEASIGSLTTGQQTQSTQISTLQTGKADLQYGVLQQSQMPLASFNTVGGIKPNGNFFLSDATGSIKWIIPSFPTTGSGAPVFNSGVYYFNNSLYKFIGQDTTLTVAQNPESGTTGWVLIVKGQSSTTINLTSPDGTKTGTLAVSNANALIFNGAAIGGTSSTGSTYSPATGTNLGLVKIGTGITVAADGTISAATGSTAPAAAVSEHVVTVKYGTGIAYPSFGAIFATGGGIPGYDNNTTYLHADSVDGYFQFTMVGTGFSLWHSAYGGQHHKYDVYIDGAVVATVDFTATANTPIYEVYRIDSLMPGVVHTVRLISVAAYAAQLKIDQVRVRGTYTGDHS